MNLGSEGVRLLSDTFDWIHWYVDIGTRDEKIFIFQIVGRLPAVRGCRGLKLLVWARRLTTRGRADDEAALFLSSFALHRSSSMRSFRSRLARMQGSWRSIIWWTPLGTRCIGQFSSSEESVPHKQTQGLRFSFLFVVVLLDATAARLLSIVLVSLIWGEQRTEGVLVVDVLVVTAPLGGRAPPSLVPGGGGVGGGVLAIANNSCTRRTDLVQNYYETPQKITAQHSPLEQLMQYWP